MGKSFWIILLKRPQNLVSGQFFLKVTLIFTEKVVANMLQNTISAITQFQRDQTQAVNVSFCDGIKGEYVLLQDTICTILRKSGQFRFPELFLLSGLGLLCRQ